MGEVLGLIESMGGYRWILSQVFSLIGYGLMVFTGYIKDEKKMLRVQNLQILFMTVMSILLNAYSAVIISVLVIIKNELYIAKKLTSLAKNITVLVACVLVYFFNNAGIVGWLPILSLSLLTYLLGFVDTIGIKILIAVTSVLWCIYDTVFTNYVGTIFDILTVISCLVGIVRIKKALKKD